MKRERFSLIDPDRPQLFDRGGKDRFLREACGKQSQSCGKRVEKVWRRRKKFVETVWIAWGKPTGMIRIAKVLNVMIFQNFLRDPQIQTALPHIF